MHPKLQQILDAANAATPGPWSFTERETQSQWKGNDRYIRPSNPLRGDIAKIEIDMDSIRGDSGHESNATYIALCNPETVKKLVEVINILDSIASTTAKRGFYERQDLESAYTILNSIGGRE